MPWPEYAKTVLNASEYKVATYILEDILWDENEHSDPDAQTYPRPLKGNQTGLEKLEDVVAEAATGDRSARNILRALLQSTEDQRSDLSLTRFPESGTWVVGPQGYILSDAPRRAIAKVINRSSKDLSALIAHLITDVLLQPNNAALATSVTAVLAHPDLWSRKGFHQEFVRDYFVLMSMHPEVKVRTVAAIGLTPFVKESSFVGELLREQNLKTSQSVIRAEDQERIDRIFETLENGEQLGPYLTAWQNKFKKIYANWVKDPFRNRILDIGDNNMERMANGAAGQALLWATGLKTQRELILTFDGIPEITTFESLKVHHDLPGIRGLRSGNGTGFFMYAKLESQAPDGRYNSYIVMPGTITIDPRPENAWILMGMETGTMSNFFAQFLEKEAIEMLYGHTSTLISILKYKVLQQPAPAHFAELANSFIDRLRKKYQAEAQELKSKYPNLKVLTMQDFIEEFSEAKPKTGEVLAFPKRESPREPISARNSIFTAPIETLFAIRGLAILGDLDTAAEVFTSLLPDHWELTTEDQRLLAGNLERYRHDSPLRLAKLSEASQQEILAEVIETFGWIWPQAEADARLRKWRHSLRDPELIARVQQAFTSSVDCERNLAGF